MKDISNIIILSKILTLGVLLIVLFAKEPDLLDAIIHRVGGWK